MNEINLHIYHITSLIVYHKNKKDGHTTAHVRHILVYAEYIILTLTILFLHELHLTLHELNQLLKH